jgi:hypothetical protein
MEGGGKTISQNIPVNPEEHSHLKLGTSAKPSSITQVPLLQSIRSQIVGGGSRISQNCPVNPEKHSQVKF